MSSGRRKHSHSTGSDPAAYTENASAFSPSPPSDESSESLSSGWDNVTDDDIGPSDSASRPPTVASADRGPSRQSSRHGQSHREVRPTSHRRKSSVRVPTVIREEERRPHRSHSDQSERRERYHREEREPQRHHREHRARVPSSSSSSVESYDSSYMGGGPRYANDLPYHPHHPAQWGHVPQPPSSNYPPTIMNQHGYDANGYPIGHHDQALMRLQAHDYMNPMAQHGGYPPSANPFGAPSSQNPFSSTPLQSSALGGGRDYFDQGYDSRPHPSQAPGPHMRPARHERPQSYGGSPYPVEGVVSPYYPAQPSHSPYGYPPGTNERLIAQHLYDLELRAKKSHSTSPLGAPTRSKSPAPAATPAPAPAPAAKEEAKDDQAARLVKLLAEYEDTKRKAEDARAKEAASAAAAEEAKKAAENAESAKIEKMLMKWEEEREKRAQAEKSAAEAARKETEAKAARDAELAAAMAAVKAAAEKEAAEKAKAAEAEATAKAKAAEEEATKKIAEAKAAAGELEKAKKALEEELAKNAPAPDDSKSSVHFQDVMGRKYDVPWRFAKTWKTMKPLIEQAVAHIDEVGQTVLEGRYDLIGPEGAVILPVVWDIVIKPDSEVKMELWPAPDPIQVVTQDLPGAFPGYPLPEHKRKKGKEKEVKLPKPKPRPSRLVEPSPAVRNVPIMVPPPHPGHMYANDPYVSIEEAGHTVRIGQPSKTKKKPPVRPGGLLANWIVGSQRRPAGKDNEKPASLVHSVPAVSSTSAPPPSSSPSSSSPSPFSSSPPHGSSQPLSSSDSISFSSKNHASTGAQRSSDRRRSASSGADRDGFYVIDRRSSKSIPSIAQGKREQLHKHSRSEAERTAECAVM